MDSVVTYFRQPHRRNYRPVRCRFPVVELPHRTRSVHPLCMFDSLACPLLLLTPQRVDLATSTASDVQAHMLFAEIHCAVVAPVLDNASWHT